MSAGFKFYGIAASQNRDRKGELILIDGLDTSNLRYISDEHEDGSLNILGAIGYNKKILNEKDASTPREKKCWDMVKTPFLYVEGELADGEGHPDAQAAAALIKFANYRPDLPLSVGLSIEGAILGRDAKDNKTIVKAVGEGAAVTIRPCNTACKLFSYNDLAKSDVIDLKIPVTYIEKLIKNMAENPGDFNDTSIRKLREKMEKLNKSLDDYKKGTQADLKCYNCGNTLTLFKTSTKWPNQCKHCGSKFNMSTIWSALND